MKNHRFCKVFNQLGGLATLFFLAFANAPSLQANDDFDETIKANNLPKIAAIQKKPIQLKSELGFQLGYLPMDHFEHYLSSGLSYSHFFSNYFSWEIFNAKLTYNQSTGLENYLLGKYSALPEVPDIIQYIATSNISYTPLYMKSLFKGNDIVWGELSFNAGLGLAKLKRDGFSNVFAFGSSMRFFSTSPWIYAIDLKQHFFTVSSVKPNLGIDFKVTYNFGHKDAQSEPETKNEDLD